MPLSRFLSHSHSHFSISIVPIAPIRAYCFLSLLPTSCPLPSGKSTLTKNLAQLVDAALQGARSGDGSAVAEEKVNDAFLAAFYAEPKQLAFAFQMYMLTTRLYQMETSYMMSREHKRSVLVNLSKFRVAHGFFVAGWSFWTAARWATPCLVRPPPPLLSYLAIPPCVYLSLPHRLLLFVPCHSFCCICFPQPVLCAVCVSPYFFLCLVCCACFPSPFFAVLLCSLLAALISTDTQFAVARLNHKNGCMSDREFSIYRRSPMLCLDFPLCGVVRVVAAAISIVHQLSSLSLSLSFPAVCSVCKDRLPASLSDRVRPSPCPNKMHCAGRLAPVPGRRARGVLPPHELRAHAQRRVRCAARVPGQSRRRVLSLAAQLAGQRTRRPDRRRHERGYSHPPIRFFTLPVCLYARLIIYLFARNGTPHYVCSILHTSQDARRPVLWCAGTGSATPRRATWLRSSRIWLADAGPHHPFLPRELNLIDHVVLRPSPSVQFVDVRPPDWMRALVSPFFSALFSLFSCFLSLVPVYSGPIFFPSASPFRTPKRRLVWNMPS
jgi:hypothetical protein